MKYFAAAASLFAAVKAASLGNTNYGIIAAGEPFTFSWYGAVGAVTLDLRYGASTNLVQLVTITSGASSQGGIGSFTWTVPSSFTHEGPYAIVITDNSGVNYSPQFPIAGASVNNEEDTKTIDAPTASAQNLKPTSPVTFEFQSSSSVAPTGPIHGATSSATVATSNPTGTTTPSGPPTVPGEGKAAGMASPLALIFVSAAVMFYLQ